VVCGDMPMYGTFVLALRSLSLVFSLVLVMSVRDMPMGIYF
jgi:hypothetical protein